MATMTTDKRDKRGFRQSYDSGIVRKSLESVSSLGHGQLNGFVGSRRFSRDLALASSNGGGYGRNSPNGISYISNGMSYNSYNSPASEISSASPSTSTHSHSLSQSTSPSAYRNHYVRPSSTTPGSAPGSPESVSTTPPDTPPYRVPRAFSPIAPRAGANDSANGHGKDTDIDNDDSKTDAQVAQARQDPVESPPASFRRLPRPLSNPLVLHPDFRGDGDVVLVCTNKKNGGELVGFRVSGSMLRMAR